MGNPFWDSAGETLSGGRVVVRTEAGTYRGYLTYFDYDDHAVMLRDVTTPSGETVPTAMVDDPIAVERDPESARRDVETVEIDAIAPQPYTVREFDTPDFDTFVRDVREDGSILNIPLVRPLDEAEGADWQIVSGHRRVAALRRGGVETHPVEVEPLSRWEATVRFIDAHFPITDTEREKSVISRSQWYAPEQMQAAFDRLRADWERETLVDHPGIAANEIVIDAEDPRAVHEVLMAAPVTDAAGDEDAEAIDDLAATLAEETGGAARRIQEDLETLESNGIDRETAEDALREKYSLS